MNWQFQYNWFAWIFSAIALFLILFLLLIRWKKKVRSNMGDERLIKALINNYSPRFFTYKFIFVSIAFAFGVVAVMNPRKPGASDGITRKGIDIAIALDVSRSMLAKDLQPDRLSRAKQFIIKLLDELPDDRIALILFAGKAYLQMPLTVDHGAAALFVSSTSTDAVPQQGTVISDALKMSANVFNTAERKFKAIVLISDGEDHDEDALSTAKDLARQGVMINSIGIGSPEGAAITDPETGLDKRDASGKIIITKLNEEELMGLATETNGIYIRLQSSDEAIAALKGQLSQIDKKAFGDFSQINFRTYYIWFAAGMLLFLMIEIFIPERRKVKT